MPLRIMREILWDDTTGSNDSTKKNFRKLPEAFYDTRTHWLTYLNNPTLGSQDLTGVNSVNSKGKGAET